VKITWRTYKLRDGKVVPGSTHTGTFAVGAYNEWYLPALMREEEMRIEITDDEHGQGCTQIHLKR